MRQNAAVAALAGALAGAAAAVLVRRRARTEPGAATPADPRADDLRRKLAEARETHAREDDFEAAGMGAETTVVEEGPRPREERPRPREERPPDAEFEAMRRRVHEEGRAAADEMRRRGEDGDA